MGSLTFIGMHGFLYMTYSYVDVHGNLRDVRSADAAEVERNKLFFVFNSANSRV
jgi:hypothetical protein